MQDRDLQQLAKGLLLYKEAAIDPDTLLMAGKALGAAYPVYQAGTAFTGLIRGARKAARGGGGNLLSKREKAFSTLAPGGLAYGTGKAAGSGLYKTVKKIKQAGPTANDRRTRATADRVMASL